MQSAQGQLGRIFVLRLEAGDRLPHCIDKFAADNAIEAAYCTLLGGIGAGRVVVGPEKAATGAVVPLLHHIENVHEALAVGTVFPTEDGTPKLHLHAALGRQGRTATGCTRLGVDVWKICEVVIVEILGTGLRRKIDPETGLELLSAE